MVFGKYHVISAHGGCDHSVTRADARLALTQITNNVEYSTLAMANESPRARSVSKHQRKEPALRPKQTDRDLAPPVRKGVFPA